MVAGGGGGGGVTYAGMSGSTSTAGLAGHSSTNGNLNNEGDVGGPGKGTGDGDGGASATTLAYCSLSESCKPRSAAKAGYPNGGSGSNGTGCDGVSQGGWGFGGGGAGLSGGGGGGGYSGGSAGTFTNSSYHGGGGGGGGSYIHPGYSSLDAKITATGQVSSPQNGYVYYGLINAQSPITLISYPTWCIDVNGSSGNGAELLINIYNKSVTSQQFIIDGSSMRLAKDINKCIDLTNGSTNNGTAIKLQDCQDNDKSQMWIYDVANQAISSGIDVTKCMDVSHMNSPGGDLQLWDCKNSNGQQWHIEGIPSALPSGTNNVIRLAMQPAKCVDITKSGTANGTNIELYDCNGTIAQNFTFDGRTIKMQSSPDKCLDLSQAKTTNGTNIQLWDCHGGTAQEWIYDGFTGTFRSAVNTDKCLDVLHSGTANGTNIQLYDCNGTDAQRFLIGQ